MDKPEIEGFEILSLAGSGGTSVVYEARQTALDRIVAVKMLHRQLMADGVTMQRFVNEGRLATELHHPNIATTLSCGATADDQLFLVLEFLEGNSLKDELAEHGPFELSKFKDIFLQVLSGLAHAHQRGIVHRDLKPGNIVLSKDGSGKTIPKIVDFGIAKFFQADNSEAQKLTRTGAMVGSPAYMSPEQCIAAAVDPRSDIYSLGCVMYECLVGKPAFDGETMLDTMSKHLHEPPTAPSAVAARPVPADLDDLILKMMAKKPEDRFATAEDAFEALSSINWTNMKAPVPAHRPAQLRQQAVRKKSHLLGSTLLALFMLPIMIWGALFVYHVNLLANADGAAVRGKYNEAADTIKFVWLDVMPDDQRQQFGAFGNKLSNMLSDDGEDALSALVLARLRRQCARFPSIGSAHADSVIEPMQKLAHIESNMNSYEAARQIVAVADRCSTGKPNIHGFVRAAQMLKAINETVQLPKRLRGFAKWGEGWVMSQDDAIPDDRILETVTDCINTYETLPADIHEADCYHLRGRLLDRNGRKTQGRSDINRAVQIAGWIEKPLRGIYVSSEDLKPDARVTKENAIAIREKEGRYYRRNFKEFEQSLLENPWLVNDVDWCKAYRDMLHRAIRTMLLIPDFVTAKSMADRQLDLARRLHDTPEEAHTLSAYYDIEKNLSKNDPERLNAATALLEKATFTYERLLPRNHPNVFNLEYKLASVYWQQGKFAEAEKLVRKVMESSKDQPDKRAAGTWVAPLLLADICAKDGRTQEALQLLEDNLEYAATRYGANKVPITRARKLHEKLKSGHRSVAVKH